MSTRWHDIQLHLQKEGFDARPPGSDKSVGRCLSPYVVVRHDGSTRYAGISTNVDVYSILVYVPKQRYSELEVQVMSVKLAMKKLEPMILPNGSETPSFYDDGFQAHMISIQYKNYKKMP